MSEPTPKNQHEKDYAALHTILEKCKAYLGDSRYELSDPVARFAMTDERFLAVNRLASHILRLVIRLDQTISSYREEDDRREQCRLIERRSADARLGRIHLPPRSRCENG